MVLQYLINLFSCSNSKEGLDNITNNKKIINDFYPIQSSENNEYINHAKISDEWIEKISVSGENYWFNKNTLERSDKYPKKKILNVYSVNK